MITDVRRPLLVLFLNLIQLLFLLRVRMVLVVMIMDRRQLPLLVVTEDSLTPGAMVLLVRVSPD